ncbi:hydroxypyruvate isomerase family protein [Aquamicrobium zhengzhouense]|uniref:hydroxypyruvate isomerase family protein n=1 Tax=Aquamicrobium zhengzhouense TaxID=2781738 RepID=UPI001AEDF8B6|nr:TIM barrel protein [Aquamicrobium zhengzhouense]
MPIDFSANLGFLFTEHSLPGAVREAKAAGFKAVELHWPYEVDPAAVKAALDESGLPVLGLNTSRGDLAAGEFGLSALPGREADARAAIDDALAYAVKIGAGAIHVMAGKTADPQARDTFIENLRYAADNAAPHGITILIEPLNPFDAPDYFLLDNDLASAIIAEAGRENIKIMFDCYHVGRIGRDPMAEFVRHRQNVGHVQFAAVPDRGEPDSGEIDFGSLLPELQKAGWNGYFGAEYKPRNGTAAGLGWLSNFKPA